jgi:hypothetical protein
MVGPGVHVNAIGGDCPGKTELSPSILQRSDVFVEYAPQTRIEGEIQQMDPDFSLVGNRCSLCDFQAWKVSFSNVYVRRSKAQRARFRAQRAPLREKRKNGQRVGLASGSWGALGRDSSAENKNIRPRCDGT